LCGRVVGDLGDVVARRGVVRAKITDHLVSLFGEYSVVGKSIVVSKTPYSVLFQNWPSDTPKM